jgi:hypothetical protein
MGKCVLFYRYKGKSVPMLKNREIVFLLNIEMRFAIRGNCKYVINQREI